jgi:hypothetical protein
MKAPRGPANLPPLAEVLRRTDPAHVQRESIGAVAGVPGSEAVAREVTVNRAPMPGGVQEKRRKRGGKRRTRVTHPVDARGLMALLQRAGRDVPVSVIEQWDELERQRAWDWAWAVVTQRQTTPIEPSQLRHWTLGALKDVLLVAGAGLFTVDELNKWSRAWRDEAYAWAEKALACNATGETKPPKPVHLKPAPQVTAWYDDGSSSATVERFGRLVQEERAQQERLHPWAGGGREMLKNAVVVLTEEVGEVAHAVLEKDAANLREELVQVAAVCQRIYERLEAA